MTRLSLRIDFADRWRIGPGKIRLLEEIATQGSISAAGRALGMSYKRAWDLVAELNRGFQEPLVTTRIGGQERGGATLTGLGTAVIAHYRAIERAAEEASAAHLAALAAVRAPAPLDQETGTATA